MTLQLVTLPGLAAPFSLFVHERCDRYISAQIRDHGYWEPFESSIVLSLLKRGDVFVDLGANIGYYTVLASRACGPEGRVYAFEPEPSNFALLSANVALNAANNVVAVNAAVADRSGSTPLYLSPDNQGDHRAYAAEGRSEVLEVPKVALDEWFVGRDDRIDLVKIDTQGSEAKILDGMARLMEANIDHIRLIIEFWPYGLEAAGDGAESLAKRLQQFDFDLYKIDESCTRPIQTNWNDVLEEASTVYHPSTQHFTNLLLTPRKATMGRV